MAAGKHPPPPCYRLHRNGRLAVSGGGPRVWQSAPGSLTRASRDRLNARRSDYAFNHLLAGSAWEAAGRVRSDAEHCIQTSVWKQCDDHQKHSETGLGLVSSIKVYQSLKTNAKTASSAGVTSVFSGCMEHWLTTSPLPYLLLQTTTTSWLKLVNKYLDKLEVWLLGNICRI